MEKAWPRFLPEPTPDAIAHALIIEAYAIVVEQLSEGHASLGEAHSRAWNYAEASYHADDVRAAISACLAAPENQTARLQYLVQFSGFAAAVERTAA
jgi:hypothetical protein